MLQPPVPPSGAVPGGPNNLGAPQPPQGNLQSGDIQVNSAAIRMAMEIDQALKLLAQALPSIAPWVAQTVSDLRQQLGQALSAPPAQPLAGPSGFPDGSARM